METLRTTLKAAWKWERTNLLRRQTIYAAIVAAMAIGLVWQLTLLPTNAAPVERSTYMQSSTLLPISENPLSLPYKLVALLITNLSDSVRALRAFSVALFCLCVISLYRILRRWHGEKVALFSTVLFATNAVSLSVARLATPLVLLFAWPVVISLLLWLQHGHSRRVAPVLLAATSAMLLFIPGAPYFFLFMFLLFSKKIKSLRHAIPLKLLIAISIFLVLLFSPLVLSFIQEPTLLREWLLLPEQIQLSEVWRNILRVPSAFIYRMPMQPLINVARLPVLDVAAGGLLLVGLYAYQKHIKLERTRVMLVTACFCIVLGALGQIISAVIILMPFVYALVGAGINHVLSEWFKVFPKNPFARSFGLLVVTTVVIMSVYYQLTRFLVVWPQTPETRSVYNESRLIQ